MWLRRGDVVESPEAGVFVVAADCRLQIAGGRWQVGGGRWEVGDG